MDSRINIILVINTFKKDTETILFILVSMRHSIYALGHRETNSERTDKMF